MRYKKGELIANCIVCKCFWLKSSRWAIDLKRLTANSDSSFGWVGSFQVFLQCFLRFDSILCQSGYGPWSIIPLKQNRYRETDPKIEKLTPLHGYIDRAVALYAAVPSWMKKSVVLSCSVASLFRKLACKAAEGKQESLNSRHVSGLESHTYPRPTSVRVFCETTFHLRQQKI